MNEQMNKQIIKLKKALMSLSFTEQETDEQIKDLSELITSTILLKQHEQNIKRQTSSQNQAHDLNIELINQTTQEILAEYINVITKGFPKEKIDQFNKILNNDHE